MTWNADEQHRESHKEFEVLADWKTPKKIEYLSNGFQILDRVIDQLSQEYEKARSGNVEFAKVLLATWLNEEAAKTAILFDFLRMPWTDKVRQRRHLKRLYDHKIKSIYAEHFWATYGTYGDYRRIVSDDLEKFVLDGDGDYSWEYSHPLDTKRHELYVGLIKRDVTLGMGQRHAKATTQYEWNDPLRNLGTVWSLKERPAGRLLKLVRLLHKASLLDRRSLGAVHESWAEFVCDESVEDHAIAEINRQMLRNVGSQGLTEGEERDLCWGLMYPLWFTLDDIESREKKSKRR